MSNEYQIKPAIISHFTDNDLYKFTMCAAIVKSFPNAVATYRFQDRNNTVYPEGFVEELKYQIYRLSLLHITDEEQEFLRKKCYYLPEWFIDYLKGVHLDIKAFNISQDKEGHLSLEFTGKWSHYVLYEVQIMAIIAELYYKMNGQGVSESGIHFDEYYKKTYDKAERMLSEGCTFAEFGTRRRYSYFAQESAVEACKNAQEDMIRRGNCPGKFTGTSNVYLAMQFGLTPIGTMAHEWISGIAGIYGSPIEANSIAMREWEKTYDGALGIYLYDTFGIDAFDSNFSDKFARSFDGVRVDSGDNWEQYQKILKIYEKHNVDGHKKLIMFSNALDTDSFIELHKRVTKDGGRTAAGIGTHLTNDFKDKGIEPMNMVIKLVKIAVNERRQMMPTCKLSNESSKYITGDEKIAEYWKYQLMLNKNIN